VASIEDVAKKRFFQKIWSYFGPEVFALIMVDSGLSHKALRVVKAIDGLMFLRTLPVQTYQVYGYKFKVCIYEFLKIFLITYLNTTY
jgi:hypothetical protein